MKIIILERNDLIENYKEKPIDQIGLYNFKKTSVLLSDLESADLVLFVDKTPEKSVFYVIKNKYGADGLVSNFIKIIDDSVYMTITTIRRYINITPSLKQQ